MSAAALVPGTALLVPGAGGTIDVAAALRAAALDAVAHVVAVARESAGVGHDARRAAGDEGHGGIVVVAAAPVTREARGRVRASLAAAGVPDGQLGWPVPEVVCGDDDWAPVGVPAAVGLHLLARSGWPGRVRVLEVGADADDEAVAVCARAAGLVVVGSLSGRHGPDAPLADDERAPAYDEALLADLATGSDDARARIAQLDLELARGLAVTGLRPWQVLVAAWAGLPVRAGLVHAQVVAGAQHAVASWQAGEMLAGPTAVAP
ncbi:hypothetical protein [Cellulomonas sp. HZM]|uniref:hypothetical protein n=1 Tax=Cellulomonas sp. HZM TaxID=1454010 RepID=UPI00049375B1|nr:hypothetical protein [Cellulomonas sp. HZM]